ncbi:hypothetical protein EFB08_02170 [Rufibacter latericius]|uniref:Uncharacterized protein n=1 Tax=Rufibacter latericius TaxID=2487040 RepID=A0A3M9N0N4_9BACT|nr:hypothetical protein EFB08_02170 [Rufibacter latericius]
MIKPAEEPSAKEMKRKGMILGNKRNDSREYSNLQRLFPTRKSSPYPLQRETECVKKTMLWA